MQEPLVEQPLKFVPDYIIKELSKIVHKQQSTYNLEFLANHDDTGLFDIYREDPELFQKQQQMSKFPGDQHEAIKLIKNQSIKEIYLSKKNLKLDWLFINIYSERFILEEYGLGVPLLFTMMKMITFTIFILFLINLYSGFQLFQPCNKQNGCFTAIGGGLFKIDIISVPNVYASSISFLIWLGLSYVLKIYVNIICKQDDNFRSSITNKTDQIILKYFEKGLNKQQVEEILSNLLSKFCQKVNKGSNTQMKINLLSVTPIKNFYAISTHLKRLNNLYIKIIKTIHKIDSTILLSHHDDEIQNYLILQKSINQNKSKKESPSVVSSQRCSKNRQTMNSILSNNSKEGNNQNFNESNNKECDDSNKNESQNNLFNKSNNDNNDGHDYNDDTQVNQSKNQEINEDCNRNSLNTSQKNDKKEELNHSNIIQPEQRDIQNENEQEEQKQGEKNLSEIIEQEEEIQNCEIPSDKPKIASEINTNINLNFAMQQPFGYQNNQMFQDKQSKHIDLDDLVEKKSKLEKKQSKQSNNNQEYNKCKVFLEQDNKKINKLINMLDKYSGESAKLTDMNLYSNTLSTSYIIKCQSVQQKQMIQMYLTPQSSIVSFFQKFKYIFCSKRYNYHLYRLERSKSTHLNINWKTIGVSLQNKLKKQTIIFIIGTIQFLLSLYIIDIIFNQKVSNDYQASNNVVVLYLKKIGLSLALSVFYLLSEKLYEFYSKQMSTSLKSKQIFNQMNNLFFFYTLSYVLYPIFSIFIYSQIYYEQQIKNPQYTKLQTISNSPFSLFVTNFLIAYFIFSFKSYIPLKWVNSKLKKQYYKKSKRYLKKTQYELNKVFKRFKFRLQDSSMSFFNLVVISIPITFILPILLIIPFLLLLIQYFAFKYHYLVLFRPTYYCKSIHLKTSKQLANYIQRISFLSFLLFSTEMTTALSAMVFYFVLFCLDICVTIYYNQNYKDKKVNPYELVQSLESQNQILKTNKMKEQLKEAVDSAQTVSLYRVQSNLLLNNFQFSNNQNQQHNNSTNLDDIDRQFFPLFRPSSLGYSTKELKKQLYSFEQAYNKYKLTQEQMQNFHCIS